MKDMAMSCYDGGDCNGCYGCLPDYPVCRICGRIIGPYDGRMETEKGWVCDSVDCRFEAAMEQTTDDDLYRFAENEKDSYVEYFFN
jgi:hypothetical protein